MSDGITVITQTTAERKAETIKRFEIIKPYLDKGWSYSRSCQECFDLHGKLPFAHTKWYKELVKYAETQGYLRKYFTYRGKYKEKREE